MAKNALFQWYDYVVIVYMVFGNWKLSDETISWNGRGLYRFVIPGYELNKIREVKEVKHYDWILLATAEDWLTQNDLYDFNYAFVYAIAKFNLEFDYDIFDNTLAEQYELFEMEEGEDDDLNL